MSSSSEEEFEQQVSNKRNEREEDEKRTKFDAICESIENFEFDSGEIALTRKSDEDFDQERGEYVDIVLHDDENLISLIGKFNEFQRALECSTSICAVYLSCGLMTPRKTPRSSGRGLCRKGYELTENDEKYNEAVIDKVIELFGDYYNL